MKKSAKSTAFSALWSSEELTADLLKNPAVVPAFIQLGLEFGEYFYLPTSQAIGNQIDFSSKRFKTLKSF
jgi:hypothetical protein